MEIKRMAQFLAVLTGILAVTLPAHAAKKKSFDLYSWPQEGSTNYCYAILPSSKEARPAADIKGAKDQVCGGRDDFKRIVGQAAPIESKLTWKVDASNGFVLPPRDIVNDFGRFSQTMDYKLTVPE